MSKLKDFLLNILDSKDPKDSLTSQEGNVESNQPNPQQAKPIQNTQSMGDTTSSETKVETPMTDSPAPSGAAEETPNEKPSSPLLGEDNIATCNNVKKALLHQLEPYLGSNERLALVMYIPDKTLFKALSAGGFKDLLHSELIQVGHSFSSERIINENPPAERALKCVLDSFYCDVERTSVDPPVSEMRVRVYDECGKTLKPSYDLPCRESARYNIGRGEFPVQGWINNIVFDPNPNDPLFFASGYVRSQHAFIRVLGGKYYLFAYPNGAKPRSRTQLLHPSTNKIEEISVNGGSLLSPGDIIILGKAAKLIFELSNE